MSSIGGPTSRRPPLGEATRRVNNSQHSQPKHTSKNTSIPHHESRKIDGQFQGDDGSYDYRDDLAVAPINPRLSAISKELPGTGSKRDSQISTTSSTASDGRRIKGHIGPWKLGKTLGKGATARVRLARHSLTGQEAAIKIVQKRNAQMSQAGSLADFDRAEAEIPETEDSMRRMPVGIEREVAIMKLIQHPNIMKLYDIWENRTEM